MATINGVDFTQVAKAAIAAAKAAANNQTAWASLEAIVKNITDGLTNDVNVVIANKTKGDFNENDAAVFMEDQKMLARIRIRSVALVGLQLAEDIWNAIADVFRKAINTAIGWTIL